MAEKVARPDSMSETSSFDEKRKDDFAVEEFEQSSPAALNSQDDSWIDRPGAVDVDSPPGWFARKFLKKNPSPEFINDVQRMNERELDEKEMRRIDRRVDWLIVPALGVCYGFYYVDKTTLAYAAIFGIKKDLNLTKSDYSWLSSIFYFGWLCWGFPTNYLMRKFPLNAYLAVNIFLWGLLLMCQAASKNFADMMVLRFLSGAFEAAADPCFLLITATWYTRGQVPTRIGLWYAWNGIGIAFGGLLGYGIGNIPSTDKFPSWKYEFLIIGAMCALWSVILYLFVPSSPYDSKWFTRRERLMIVSKKRNEQTVTDNRHWKWDQFFEGLLDPKIYLFFLFGFTANVPNGITSNFGTLIVKGFGFSTLGTTLMQIPYGTIIACIILLAIYLNRVIPPGNRTYLMAATNVPTVVGFAMMRWCSGTAPRLIGYWMTGASNATFVLGLSIVSGNVGGQTKRAVASAAVFLGLAAGNIVGPFLCPDRQAPLYPLGVVGSMVSRALEIVVILVLRVIFVWQNKKRDRAVKEGRVTYNADALALEDISDWKNPAFRYIT
ncbi:MFS general substrate transporter [Atractiella rhizophila]|nr:MFS general substrate transporter [Atractiella rhizophila]